MKSTISHEKCSRKLKQIELLIISMKEKKEISLGEFKDLQYFVNSIEEMFKI